MKKCDDIRQASRADLAAVLRLYGQSELDDGAVLTQAAAEEIFARMERYPDYHLYVAVSGRRIVGTFALLIMDNLGHLGAPSGLMEDVAVDPVCQGQGVGREMVEHAIGLCRQKGCYKLALSANLKRGAGACLLRIARSGAARLQLSH
jgi:GNAT superfamily N-acetyltransferase